MKAAGTSGTGAWRLAHRVLLQGGGLASNRGAPLGSKAVRRFLHYVHVTIPV